MPAMMTHHRNRSRKGTAAADDDDDRGHCYCFHYHRRTMLTRTPALESWLVGSMMRHRHLEYINMNIGKFELSSKDGGKLPFTAPKIESKTNDIDDRTNDEDRWSINKRRGVGVMNGYLKQNRHLIVVV